MKKSEPTPPKTRTVKPTEKIYLEIERAEKQELNEYYLALGFCIAVVLFCIFAIWFSLNYQICTILK